MTLRNGQWANRPDPLYDHSHEYPLANVLHERPNISIRSVPWYDRWWAFALQAIVIAGAIICCMNEAGCFDNVCWDK